MRRPRFLEGYPWWYVMLAALFAILVAVVIAVVIGVADGSFHFQETAHVNSFLIVGKDHCLLQDPKCVQQYAVEIQQGSVRKKLIFDIEAQIPPVTEGGTIIFIGPTGPTEDWILAWHASAYTPNTDEIPPVWEKPTQEAPAYSG